MKSFLNSFMVFFSILLSFTVFSQKTPDGKSFFCDVLLFFEDWAQGTFAYNNWELDPTVTNWNVKVNIGNPAPSADFKSYPIQVNYSFSLITQMLHTSIHSCAKIWCDFDYKLVSLNNTGNEKLFVDVFSNGEWKNRAWLSNTEDKEWTHLHVYLTEGTDTAIKVRFRAEGINSADIQHWYIDNILIDVKCNPPVELTIQEISGQQVSLTWDEPDCDS